ncbi:MAG TPA: class I SAM-dependent methyltransferase [Polyangiales bacterium]
MTTPAYDPLAELYDRAFARIEVRAVEWRWLLRRLARLDARPRLLEIGCGTGALLRALAPRVAEACGVDISPAMIERAKARASGQSNLDFRTLSGVDLPFAAQRFDVVVSFLSFRYLDWTRIWPEIRRVLAPGGRFWLVDLVRQQSSLRDTPRLLRTAARHALGPLRHPRFTRDLRTLTGHADWKAMLERHPMRAQDEYAHFFAARLPEARLVPLDVLPSRRIVALDSGPLW